MLVMKYIGKHKKQLSQIALSLKHKYLKSQFARID